MKKISVVIVCFALVFGLGIVAGWLLKPAPVIPTTPATDSVTAVGEALFLRLDNSLHFNVAQKEKIQSLCQEMSSKMAGIGRRPLLRKEIFETYAAKIREQLTTGQLPAYDAMVNDARSRHEHLRQR